MYRCIWCGKVYERLPTNPSGRILRCPNCSKSKVYVKARPRTVRRVKAV